MVIVCPHMSLKLEGLDEFPCRRIYHGIDGPYHPGSETAVTRLGNILTKEKQEEHPNNPDGFRGRFFSQCQDMENANWNKAYKICYTKSTHELDQQSDLNLPNGYLVEWC